MNILKLSVALVFVLVLVQCGPFRAVMPLTHSAEERFLAADTTGATTNLQPPVVNLDEDINRHSGSNYNVVELEYEFKKLRAELRHLQTIVDNLEAKSNVWLSPTSAYEKEIILKNGTQIYGNIITQDVSSLTLETFIGQLVVPKDDVLRVENLIKSNTDDTFGFDLETHPFLAETFNQSFTKNQVPVQQNILIDEYPAHCVLVGKIDEFRDRLNNTRFMGTIKNEGGVRADFVRIVFTIRTDWSGSTKDFTAFVKGSVCNFENGIVSDASLESGDAGNFEIFIPQDFATHLGYTYKIEWENYD
ncbi:MAG: hypothetical protein ISS00_00265 [Candidatus Marinimicrobia bacterium]|nr:hypothetical protein [Candidatus Neomarinimicrobiota bacterium]